jgi:Asp-tRNA(Asn)/Glu-tRNA(Gln) amidotransferase A subunit family amidase
MRVGVPKEFFANDLNSAVAETIEASLKELEKLGAKLVGRVLALNVPGRLYLLRYCTCRSFS